MKLDEHINNLKKYCEIDKRLFNNYLKEPENDFTIFCHNHVADIEAVINELERYRKNENKM